MTEAERRANQRYYYRHRSDPSLKLRNQLILGVGRGLIEFKLIEIASDISVGIVNRFVIKSENTGVMLEVVD